HPLDVRPPRQTAEDRAGPASACVCNGRRMCCARRRYDVLSAHAEQCASAREVTFKNETIGTKAQKTVASRGRLFRFRIAAMFFWSNGRFALDRPLGCMVTTR